MALAGAGIDLAGRHQLHRHAGGVGEAGGELLRALAAGAAAVGPQGIGLVEPALVDRGVVVAHHRQRFVGARFGRDLGRAVVGRRRQAAVDAFGRRLGAGQGIAVLVVQRRRRGVGRRADLARARRGRHAGDPAAAGAFRRRQCLRRAVRATAAVGRGLVAAGAGQDGAGQGQAEGESGNAGTMAAHDGVQGAERRPLPAPSRDLQCISPPACTGCAESRGGAPAARRRIRADQRKATLSEVAVSFQLRSTGSRRIRYQPV